MAKKQQQNGRQQQQQQQRQQQLPVIFMTICFVVVSLLMKLDSVSASGLTLNGNGNLLQQHHQQLQQQQQHIEDNGEENNYNMDTNKQRTSTTVPSSTEILEDEDEGSLKSNSLSAELARSQLTFSRPYQSLTMVKRAPTGFVGMRGKKDFYEEEDIDEDNSNRITFPWEEIQNSDENINWDDYAKPNGRRYKKAPTAFYGVRGKKFASINGANPSNNNHRWQELLEKLEEERMRDVILQEYIDHYSDVADLQGEMEKRAPTGFTGMRGKRPALDEAGMEKRGLGNNAFIGVRGKKDVSHQAFKRSPGSQRYFFDFWKKSSSGGSGKQQRFADFGSNKFVAVRGKKDFTNDNKMRTLYNGSPLSSSANSRLLFGNSGKRTPSGFQGMRGKRPCASVDV